MSKTFAIPPMPLFRRRQPSLIEIGALLDSLPDAALLLDFQQNRILLANARVTELTAFTRAELTSSNLASLLPAISGDCLKPTDDNQPDSILAALATRYGPPIEVWATLVRLDAQGIWALATLEPVALHDQHVAKSQRQIEQLENLHDLAVAFQETDIPLALNAALAAGHRLTGATTLVVYLAQPATPGLQQANSWGEMDKFPDHLPPGEIKALLDSPLWIPGKRATSGLVRAARARKMAYLAVAPLGKPEALIGLLVIASSEATSGEDPFPLLLILADTITGIIQQELFRSNLQEEVAAKRLALLIGNTVKEAIQEGSITLTPDMTISEMNPAAEALLGYATREICGQPVGNVLIGPENLVSALSAAQQGIPTLNLGDVHLHRRDGVAFLAHIRVFPLAIADQFEGVIILVRDLSEHEQFQVRNQQLEQRAILGEVTAIFAHEVRNPINNISTGLQLMAMNLPPDDPNQELIARLNQDCTRLTHLMDSVLSFSRPTEYKYEPIDLHTLLKGLIDRWRPRLIRLNVQHDLSISSQRPVVTGDPRALEQVFNNLINNAVQAMSDKGGRLTIQVRPGPLAGTKEQIGIRIADNGPGIPDDIRERIFEPFFTTNRNGTGLGLAIAKRIINAHKGTIEVSSVPGGTVFQVYLPLSPAPDD